MRWLMGLFWTISPIIRPRKSVIYLNHGYPCQITPRKSVNAMFSWKNSWEWPLKRECTFCSAYVYDVCGLRFLWGCPTSMDRRRIRPFLTDCYKCNFYVYFCNVCCNVNDVKSMMKRLWYKPTMKRLRCNVYDLTMLQRLLTGFVECVIILLIESRTL